MDTTSAPFRPYLIESLKKPEEAIAYLEAICEEAKSLNTEDQVKLLMSAAQDILEAYGDGNQ